MAGPPRRWIAPSTPPPPSRDELAALTTASTRCAVMSPVSRVILMACGFHDSWQLNHFWAIDRREGTVAGGGTSNLAAGAGRRGRTAPRNSSHRHLAVAGR